MPDTYFQLADHVGIEPPHLINEDGDTIPNPAAGQVQPLQPVTVRRAVPILVDGEPAVSFETATIAPIPGTRILKIDDELVAEHIRSAYEGVFVEIDPPTKKVLDQARDSTHDARERPASADPDSTPEG